MSEDKYPMTSADIAGFAAFVLIIAFVFITVNRHIKHEVNMKEWMAITADHTVQKTEILAPSFEAERMVACDKGYGRSWRRYTGSHLAPVTVTPVRITYESGRVVEGEELTNKPPEYVRCSWRDSEFREAAAPK